MTTQYEITLLDGIFSADEATNLLLSFLESKISFHQMEIFSAREASVNADVSRNEKRLDELMQARKKLKDLLAGATQKHQQLALNSVIRMRIIDETSVSRQETADCVTA